MAKGSIKASPRISPDSDTSDPTLSFFNKPHTITLLVSTFLFLLYVAFYTNDTDENINNKWGLGAGSMVFIIIGIVLFRDGPFIRPHPAMWRAVLAMNVLYEMGLIYILFQNKASARGTMKFFDSKLGIPLPEKSYAENCEFTPANVWDGIDIFVLAHSLGWFGKALILRDNLICWIISIFFELCEYSLEHQLANFAECWWDHFTPHSWTSYEWAPTRRLFNYFGFVILILAFTLAELNVFYLKYLLWVPPEHYLVIARLSLIFLFGIPCVREYYEFYSNP
ncbi:Phosphatidylserine synthase 2 [Smittium culicis]|uniref:Phosphatidylserine synthase 2 n=1 Tax=Smittium culicis TaxID=133412 RepID=A0A1R1YE32_9FUNG|nr:Phosphatidylserine synthase 2 [Smittium culicis]